MAVKIGEEVVEAEIEVNDGVVIIDRKDTYALAINGGMEVEEDIVPTLIEKDGKVYKIKTNCFDKSDNIEYVLLAEKEEDINFIKNVLSDNHDYKVAKATKDFNPDECVELYKKLNNTLYKSGYITLLVTNVMYNGNIGVSAHFDIEEWVLLWLSVNVLYYQKYKSTPVIIKEVLIDPGFKTIETEYEKVVITTINNLKEKEVDDMVKTITSSGGGGGSAECGIGCYIGAGLALVAVGAALWWGYNNFIGDGVSDEPIAIPDNY